VLTFDEIDGMAGQQEALPLSQFTGKKINPGDKSKTAPRVTTDFVEAANGDIIPQVIVSPRQKIHQVHKPPEFSYYFSKLIGGTSKYILDPFCGSTSLLTAFKKSVGVDLKDWRSGEQYIIEKQQIAAEAAERASRKVAKEELIEEGSSLEAKRDTNKLRLGWIRPAPRMHARLLQAKRKITN
jgi:hypothetical protein